MITTLFVAAAAAELTLGPDDAVRHALQRAPTVARADLAEAIARIEARRARLDRFSVSVDATSGLATAWQDPPDVAASATDTLFWDAAATASVPLFAGGAWDAAVHGADARLGIAGADSQDARRGLARAVRTAYWTVVGVDARIAAATESLHATRRAHAIVEGRAGAGLAGTLDVNRSRVGLLAEESTLLGLQDEGHSARQDLLVLLHEPADTGLVLTGDITPSGVALDAPALLRAALQVRPDLRASALGVDAAAADRRAALAGWFPSVTADASVGVGATGIGGIVDSGVGPVDVGGIAGDELRPTPEAAAGLTLHWNPFNLWRTADAVRAATHAASAARLAQEGALRAVEGEIRAAVHRVATLRAEDALVQQQVELARENNRIVQDLYGLGSATLLDLLEAAAAFRDASARAVQHRVDLVLAEVALTDATGAPIDEVVP